MNFAVQKKRIQLKTGKLSSYTKEQMRRFGMTFAMLGAGVTVGILLLGQAKQVFSFVESNNAVVQAGLPLWESRGEALPLGTGTAFSEKIIDNAIYFPDSVDRTDWFPTKSNTLQLGTDWEEEDASKWLDNLPNLSQNQDTVIPSGMQAILSVNLADHDFGISNYTKTYSPDIKALSTAEYPIPSNTGTKDAPAVLIIHTHATECYAAHNEGWYDRSNEVTRSTDETQNMIAVGAVLAQTLEENGIGVLHITTQFDAKSYNTAYNESAKAVREALRNYPSICYILDIHRDAMIKEDGSKLRPVCSVNGKSAAQLMLVVGTDEAGGYHPNWQNNLTVAAHLQKALIQTGTEIVRPINLRSATFNQQYATGSFLVEIGTTGNTLEEAKTTAEYFGKVFAKMVRTGQ